MRTPLRCSTLVATLCLLAPAAAQEPLRQPTLQERVTRLESDVARMETRFGVQSARPADLGTGESGAALAARVDALERQLQRVASDVQRIERLADSAARDAAAARRDAQAAQQSARDAALRR